MHGALDAKQSQELSDHLRTCASCERYRSIAERTRQTMSTNAVGVIARVEWIKLERSMRNAAARMTQGFARQIVMLAVLVPVMAWGTGSPGERLALAVEMMAIGGVVVFLRAIFEAKATRRIASLERPHDLLAHQREHLRRALTSTRVKFWVSPFVVAFIATMAVIAIRTGHPGRYVFACGVAGGLVVLETIHRQLLRPRLVRELAELEPKSLE
ncbi:MAG: hypothetical protein NVS3B20_16970 [Polyangiales bacterium]